MNGCLTLFCFGVLVPENQAWFPQHPKGCETPVDQTSSWSHRSRSGADVFVVHQPAVKGW